ncbi:MAG: glyceraldehyde 3-phosphate dehydrogenase NAD-binding domain-containing protein [Nanoarchaeota archaeon]|mgnify:CR=1 FL=1
MKNVIGINGFGRIGRAFFRKTLETGDLTIAVINDINPDKGNIVYQLEYDSTYGPLNRKITPNEHGMIIDGKQIYVYHEKDIDEVLWEKHGVERIIDASGIFDNMVKARNLKGRGIKQCIVTRTTDKPHILDKDIIIGINEHTIDLDKDFVISSSICDAISAAPVIDLLHKNYGVEHGDLVTLHPWLANQRLLDGPSVSWSRPGHIDAEYVQGRAAPDSILPKPTSAINAVSKVLPHIQDKFTSYSFRVPTPIVSTAYLSVKLSKKASKEDIVQLFTEAEKNQKHNIFANNFKPLVSIDFKKNESSAIIDHRATSVNPHNNLRMNFWYDNEWGYSCRVFDLTKYLFSRDQ